MTTTTTSILSLCNNNEDSDIVHTNNVNHI